MHLTVHALTSFIVSDPRAFQFSLVGLSWPICPAGDLPANLLDEFPVTYCSKVIWFLTNSYWLSVLCVD